jgi:uncharacterized RmlC-like cupin family protein
MKTGVQQTCVVVSSGDPRRGKQGLEVFAGISTETAGATGICMHLVIIPPGAAASAHLHQDHETAIYVLDGEADLWFGASLEECLTSRAGDFLYIPAGMPHLPVNASATEPCVVVLARTDPNEQESVVLRPDLDAVFSGARAEGEVI